MWSDFLRGTGDNHRAISEIDEKIANIYRAIEDGFQNAAWANQRIFELQMQRDELQNRISAPAEPPFISIKDLKGFKRDFSSIMADSSTQVKKELVRSCVKGIKLAPDRQQVVSEFRLPERNMNSDLAGGGFEPPTSGL